jgi:hypothetical protein
MCNLLALAGPLLSCYFLLRLFRPAGISERVLIFFCLLTAHVAALGYVLSYMDRLSDIRYWSVLGTGTALVSAAVFAWIRNARQSILPKLGPSHSKPVVTSVRDWYVLKLSCFEKLLLTPLMLTCLLLGILNLIVIIYTAPHNGDSMVCYLARVAYYLQHGNLNYFDANFSAQVVQPKNSSLWLLFTYLVSGRNENATQLVQFISYWVAVCSVYAISREVGGSKAQGIFAAMVSALLTEWLMEATTTQNDMIMTAFFGIITYSLLAFRQGSRSKYLILVALGTGLALGTKASAFLPLLSIGFITVYALLTARPRLLPRNSAILLGSTLAAICVFVLPSGYVDNYLRFGHPIGPKQAVTEHAFENVGQIARNGTKNVFRYGFDFLSLDGLPAVRVVREAQTVLRILPEEAMRGLGIDLETTDATVMPFKYSKAPMAHEDHSQWGALGFALVWIAVFLSVFGITRSPDIRVLSIAAVLLVLSESYVGPYDPWRGRHLIACAIFAVPAVGAFLQVKRSLAHAYLLLIVIIGCLSAVSAVVLRENGPLISLHAKGRVYTTSVFTLDRIGQLVRNDTSYYEAIKRLDSLVPDDATVAVALIENQYEYPLFGRHLTRTLIPINSFDRGLQPIPPTADFLVYQPEAFPYASPNDVHLGTHWYLRQLTDGNRGCP